MYTFLYIYVGTSQGYLGDTRSFDSTRAHFWTGGETLLGRSGWSSG